MVAATEEEAVPVLPPRSSSRELGQGVTSGMKILVAAVLGGAALVGIGAGVAFKEGLLTTSAVLATPRPGVPNQHDERSHEFLTVTHAGGKENAETLKTTTTKPEIEESKAGTGVQADKVSDAHVQGSAQKSTQTSSEVGSDSMTHNEGDASSKNKTAVRSQTVNRSRVSNSGRNSTHNHTRGDTKSDTHNDARNSTHNDTEGTHLGSHNGTQNESRNNTTHNETHNGTGNATGNSTHNATHNATHNSIRHKQLKCKGGSLAACQCLFACKVFGSQPSQCSGSKIDLMDKLIRKALSSSKDACRGMQCIVRCSKTLKCYDDRVERDCRALANHSKNLVEDEEVEGSQCRYECDKDEEVSAS